MFKCKHCGKLFKANPRIKSLQHYCRLPRCQAARKNAWRRAKNSRDEVYRKKRHVSNKLWRKYHTAYSYQQKYRATHPEYVVSNREKQQRRNNKRIKKIVKSDALSSEMLINTGLYSLSPCKENSDGKIVKSDALTVQLILIQSDTMFCVQQKIGL